MTGLSSGNGGNYDARSNLCGESIFDSEWWAEASNPGQWEKVQHLEGGAVVAELTFVRRKRMGGLREIGMPSLADTMAPRLLIKSEKYATLLSRSTRLISELTAKLPQHDSLTYTLSPGSQLELPFALCGYQTEGRYTFRAPPGNPDALWAGLARKTRNRIRGGRRCFQIEQHLDLDRFIRLSKAFLNTKTAIRYMEYDALERVFAACMQRGQATILSAVDQKGADVASVILIWDATHLYFWRGARLAESSRTSAVSLLIWAAIELASDRGLNFDMDGYATPAGGLFYAKFGLEPVRRVNVSRQTVLSSLAATSRTLLGALTPDTTKNLIVRAVNQCRR